MEYVIIGENGRILGITSCSPEEVEANVSLNNGLFCVEGNVDSELFYFDGSDFRKKPPKPSPHHIFDYTTKQWIDPRTPDTEWPLVRAKRSALLNASDWTQLPDVPLATKTEWAAYRQALRDITLQADPFNIVWPVAP